jgi:hypothetical protein
LQRIEIHVWTNGRCERWLVEGIGSISISGLLFDWASIALPLGLGESLTLLSLEGLGVQLQS